MCRFISRALFLALFAVHVLGLAGCNQSPPPEMNIPGAGAGDYLFCFWNVENLFDDQNDHRSGPGDKEYDAWLADHPEMLKLKLEKLSEAIVGLNGGRGPDILAVCEVESIRAAELLQKALNDRLTDATLHYTHLLMKEIKGGRHIAPAILTRLPVIADKTRTHGNRLRILEGHIVVDGHELIVFASHWTSQIKEGSERGRNDYANKIYGAANAIHHANPKAAVLIAGDFNTTPDDEAVAGGLHIADDPAHAKEGEGLHLINLMSGKEASKGFGTHYYKHWLIYDQIVVSPSLLQPAPQSGGWTCDPSSIHVVQSLANAHDKKGRPWRFGGENEKGPRGYSDHFPVTVRLKVER